MLLEASFVLDCSNLVAGTMIIQVLELDDLTVVYRLQSSHQLLHVHD